MTARQQIWGIFHRSHGFITGAFTSLDFTVTHMCVGDLTIIGLDNGLSPGQRQAIIWTNAGLLLIGTRGTNFNEILIKIHEFSFKKIHLKMSSGEWRQFCLGLKLLNLILLMFPKSMTLLYVIASVFPMLISPFIVTQRGTWKKYILISLYIVMCIYLHILLCETSAPKMK